MKQPKFKKKWNWMAMNEYEMWKLFDTKPFIDEESGIWDTLDDESVIEDGDIFEPAKDWKKSLIRINK
jgi:hypothetical protein